MKINSTHFEWGGLAFLSDPAPKRSCLKVSMPGSVMNKEYYNQPKMIRSEFNPAGFRCGWYEVAEGEAIYIKMPGNPSAAKMILEAERRLAKLKVDQILVNQLAALEAEVSKIRKQLGIE